VTAELPSMNDNEIEVLVSGDTLTLKGEKPEEKEQKDQNLYLSGRSYGSFRRNFQLPDGVDREKIAADFSKGVLTVTMPKTAKAKAVARHHVAIALRPSSCIDLDQSI
jgi:HSP20 family protein